MFTCCEFKFARHDSPRHVCYFNTLAQLSLAIARSGHYNAGVMGTLHIRARRLVIYAMAAALAMAGSVSPRHVQVAAHAHVTAGVVQQNAGHHGKAAHHADMAVSAQPPCHGASEPAPPSRADHGPLTNCCVASCAAIALIFASADLQQVLERREFIAVPPAGLMPVTLASADPPPR